MKLASFLSILVLISCTTKNPEKELITNFIDEIWFTETADYGAAKKYVDFGSMPPEKANDVLQYIHSGEFNLFKNLSTNTPYRIISHQELQAKKIALNFKYDDYSKVYHMLVNDGSVNTSFVVDDGKIISFSYNLIKNKTTPLTPAIWNRMEWND